MRIRKNARLILGGGGSSASSSSTSSLLICQLNRSPWDVDTFSLQGELDDGISLGDSILASDSLHSGESMELSFEYVEKKVEEDEIAAGGEEEFAITTPFCSRVDGPNPNPPKRISHTLCCDHQISQLHLNPTAAKKVAPPPPPPTVPRRRGRPKKPTTTAAATAPVVAATASNPYEFYYYSGFGPRWGKRRGNHNSTTTTATTTENYRNPYENRHGNGVETPGSSQIMSGEEDDYNEKNNNVNEELDYIDDDDEEEEEFYGGRRARKPIKARSLKSLM